MTRDSRSGTVTKQIRADIINSELPAGSRLTEALLAERYQVSRIPVRESLRALAAEGLVEIRPYAGARVAAVPDDDAADLFAIRIELEGATARRATERSRNIASAGGGGAGFQQLRDQLSQVLIAGDAAVSSGDFRELAALNMRFHQLVAELSGSPTLASLLEQISGRIEWLYSVNLTQRGGQAWAEHHQILSAIDAGDPLRAAALMRGHVRKSKESYFKHIAAKQAASSTEVRD
ncbi:GntR family transcriptional regulator [Nesterenkonia massiliensis]|uniref:GntR family transcriptional regulator n=1 Tax=Nesterenkonia massiliensis TaxID=1232429 RepID=A0ABT2HTG8_9MICC|nr:GntR family transcriptional regulator [Nesterenkonia massiliensis]MCT1607990.1 GntR family transcriptional regulator [Nesterenkonia massiliensis]